MKKLILLVLLLNIQNVRPSQLVIENYTAHPFTILFMGVSIEGENSINVGYEYENFSNQYWVVPSLSTFVSDDGNFMNRQFPFHNNFPYLSNVYTNNPSISIPLPPTTDNEIDSSTRYKLNTMRWVLGPMDYSANLAGSFVTNPNGGLMSENISLNAMNNFANCDIEYIRISSIYYINIQ